METLVRQVAISALLMLIAVIVFVPISPVSTATPTTPSSTITSSSTTHPSTTYHDTTRGESTYHETTAAAPAFTFHTWTGHPIVNTTVTVAHTHTRWTDPSPPYSWPPPGYSQPTVGYCDPNDPYNYCWDPQCAPQCGYQAVITESGTTIVTSIVTAQPSTVVITQTQPQTITTSASGGIPGFPFESILVGIVLGVLALAFSRRRKLSHPKQLIKKPN